MYGVGESSSRRRSLQVIFGVMFLALIVLGLSYAFYALVLNNDSETPVATDTPTATVQVVSIATNTPETVRLPTNTAASQPATATTRPTLAPTNTAQPTPTLRPPPEVITVGVQARVNISTGLAINLRDLPGLTGSTVITQLLAGNEVNVTAGPEDIGDLRWWNVDGGEGRAGWVVESFGGETWLLPIGWSDQLEPVATVVAVETPTATPTAAPETATPTVTGILTPTATAVLTPTTTPEGGIPSPTVGQRARVTTRFEYINLRNAPGLDAETVGQLPDGTIVTILDGPEEANDIRWWNVEDEEGNTGWAAERVADEVLLVPTP